MLLLSHAFSISSSFFLSYRLLPNYRHYLRAGAFAPGPFAAHAWLLLLIFPLWYLLLEALGLNSATRLSWRAVIARTVRLQFLR